MDTKETCAILITAKRGSVRKAGSVSGSSLPSASILCNDFTKAVNSLRAGKLGDLVDFDKPLGFTCSWFAAKISMAGFENLQGQRLMEILSFSGRVTNGYGDDKVSLYEDLAAKLSSCLSGYKKTTKTNSETGTKVTEFKSSDGRTTVTVEFTYNGKDEKGVYFDMRSY